MTYADFQIVSHPDFLSMTPGAVVSYYAVLDGMKNDALLEDYSFRWQCINDPATARGAGTKIFAGPTTRHWKNAKWDFTGLHRIVLHVTFPNGEKRSYERRQWIDSAHNILGREFDPRANDTLPGPYQALAHQEVYLQTLQDMAASHAPPADKKEAHDELVARTTAYVGHLKFLLKGLAGKEAYAVDALHLDTERSTRLEARYYSGW